MYQGGGDVENPGAKGSSQSVVVEGGDWSHATLGNKTVHKTVVNTYRQDATGDTYSLPPGQFGLTQRIIVYEDDPINPESRIYRAKLENKLLGDKEIVAKILRAGKRQMREAKIYFTVPHHPNIVERIAADTFKYMGQNCIYIAMEQCDPLNLHAYVKSQIKKKVPFDAQQALSFSYQIALGVEFLHLYRVANRDLKPDNILMSTDKKTVKVCDFGLSKVSEDDRSLTQSAVQPGTDGWRSPELLRNVERISLATDIFSLALIIVFLWSYGRHAFGDDPHAWNYFIKRGINMNLEIILIPNAIEARAFLKLMLEQDPSRRPTANEVVRNKVFTSLAIRPKTDNISLADAMEMLGLATPPKQRLKETEQLPPSDRVSNVHTELTPRVTNAMMENTSVTGMEPRGAGHDKKSEQLSPSDRVSNVHTGRIPRGINAIERNTNVAKTEPRGAAHGRNDLEMIAAGTFAYRRKPLRTGYMVFEGEKRYEGGVDPTPAAIKLLNIGGNDDKWPVEYQSEINNMKKIDGHYIAQFIDCGKVVDTKYQIYIATKLCHTNTLQDIDISGLKSHESWGIFLHICHGLKIIHKFEIAHRDLKPGNILFSLNGKKALITDFGLSKDVKIDHKTSTITRSSAPGGSQGWVAAELLPRGEPFPRKQPSYKKQNKIDYLKADIFSLGSVGHFTLCNKELPFCDDNNPTSTLHQEVNILDRKPLDLQRKLGCIEDGEIAIDCFEKMLSHTPEQRPDIEEVLRHCMFWDSIKKVNFFREMHQHFKRRNLKGNGTEEQQLACELVRLAAEADSAESENEAVITSDAIAVNVEDEPQFWEEETTEDEKRQAAIFSYIRKVATKYWLAKVKKPVAEATASLREEAPGQSDVKPEREVDGKPSCRATGKSSKTKRKHTSKQKRSDEIVYKNTLGDLIRYIRNFSVHRTDPNDPSPCKTVWELFSPLFPKLLPYLFKIMELSFNEEDKQQFMEEASPRPIDIKHLLDA